MKLTREEIEGYRKFLRGITNPDGWVDALCDAALQSLSQEAVRDEALEEAARVVWVDGEKPCETWTDSQTGKPTFDPIQVSRMQLAAAILALKREPNAAPTREESRQDWDAVLSAEPAPAAPDVAKMEEKVWKCKVGGLAELPEGADWPMRVAVSDAFKKVTGKDAQFCFSGWGATLTEPERAVVEKRLPIHGTLPPGASDE